MSDAVGLRTAQIGQVGGVGDDGVREVADAAVTTSGVVPDEGERVVDADPASLRDDPFGLLDDDAAVERALELFGEYLAAADGAFLQQSDRGDVGQGLHD